MKKGDTIANVGVVATSNLELECGGLRIGERRQAVVREQFIELRE